MKDLSSWFDSNEKNSTKSNPLPTEANPTSKTKAWAMDTNRTGIETNQEFLIELIPIDGNHSESGDLNSSGQIFRAILREK